MKKLVLICIAVLMMLPLSAQAEKITILCVTSPETEALKAAAEEFKKQNPEYEIVFNEQGRLGYFTSVTTQLVGGTDEFDLIQDNTTYMTELAAAGALEPWDEYLNDPELTDLEAFDLDDLPIKLEYEGKIY
ncbi:MAG: extracellular solute-binding protein, partial [bacterium]|nr:extracellular solute-binding protein [bacterium]